MRDRRDSNNQDGQDSESGENCTHLCIPPPVLSACCADRRRFTEARLIAVTQFTHSEHTNVLPSVKATIGQNPLAFRYLREMADHMRRKMQ